MTDWAAFVGVTGVVLLALLLLARASSDAVATAGSRADGGAEPQPRWAFERKYFDTIDQQRRERAATSASEDTSHSSVDGPDDPNAPRTPDDPGVDPITGVRIDGRGGAHGISTSLLLLNVALSQGLFGVVLVGAVVYTAVPLTALGIDLASGLSTGLPALGLGIVLGVGLYVANAVGAAGAASFGLDHDETLRDLLTPDSAVGWVVLLGGVLPIIAGFEELLFRAALVGAPAAGFGISPWLLAVGSSVAFALGHGAQGRLGVLMTGLLGFVLAAAFVVTDSLLVVVVAHYLVNALEFVVGGYLGVEWGS